MGWLRVLKMSDLTAFYTRDTLDQFAVVMNAMEYNQHPLYSRDCGRIVFDFMLYDKDVHTYENVCKTGNLTVLKWLVRNDDVGGPTHGIIRPLGKNDPQHLVNACRNGDWEMVKYLTEVVKVTRHDRGVYAACEGGYLEIVKYLIPYCRTIDAIDYHHALEQACLNERLDVVEFLTSQGALVRSEQLMHSLFLIRNMDLIKLAIWHVHPFIDVRRMMTDFAIATKWMDLLVYLLDDFHVSPEFVLLGASRMQPPQFEVMDYLIHERNVRDVELAFLNACRPETRYSTEVIAYLANTGYVSRELYSAGLLRAFQGRSVTVVKYLVNEYFVPITAEMIAIATGWDLRLLRSLGFPLPRNPS
jgi:Ankyrin repeats (3 copies)